RAPAAAGERVRRDPALLAALLLRACG
ncbi:MAG: hypothetical protein QOI73_2917, partial [Solirubrobacteraceae bacterium]|nr:hypothetical protein [Solirubrobacteraceae bacterium]